MKKDGVKNKLLKVEENIFKLDSTSMYYVRVTKLIGGKRKERYATVKGRAAARNTKQEFLKELEQEKEEVETGMITIEKLFEVWLDSKRELTLGTIGTYKNQQARINKTVIKNTKGRDIEVGKIYVNQLKQSNFVNFKETLFKENLSSTYVNSLLKQLFTLYEYAKLKDYVKEMDFHSLKGIREPEKQGNRSKNNKYTYTEEEIAQMMDSMSGTMYYWVVLIGFNTGMRISEILNLRFSDIDFEEGYIHINKQLQYYTKSEVGKQGYYIVDPKTAESIRTIKAQRFLIEELNKLREKRNCVVNKLYIVEQEKNIKKIRIVKIDDFICVNENGKHLPRSTPQDIEKIIKEKTGINFKSHEMRKYHTTYLFHKGLHLTGISERLGHKDIGTTIKKYLKYTKAEKEIMDKIINSLDKV